MRHNQPQALPPLARSALNRDATTRLDSTLLAATLQGETARFVILNEDRMLGWAEVVEASDPSDNTNAARPGSLSLVFLTLGEVRARLGLLDTSPLPEMYYLGRTIDYDSVLSPDTPIFVVPQGLDSAADSQQWLSLRVHASQLNDRDAGIFTTALALARWNESTGFDPHTGAATQHAQGGWMRVESQSGADIYPRMDPAIIVLITDAEERVLLGSNILWPEHQYSLLAGFVEAGESIEAAVHREIAEEAGITLVNVRYQCSQPWPFPRSLMLGFRAQLAPGIDPGQVTPDETELVDLRWFTRDEIRDPNRSITLPGEASIARFLITQWLHEDTTS